MRFFLLVIIFIVFSSCNDTGYVYYNKPPEEEIDKNLYPLSLMQMNSNIDILFVIDNSGSMSPYHQNLIANAKIFLEQFASQTFINWKIGIVSTDDRENPYLGFDESFDWKLIKKSDPNSFKNMVYDFQTAVSLLGTNGSGSEYVFSNIKLNLDRYNGTVPTRPAFLRPNSHFVVVMITDEPEQSLGSLYRPTRNFYQYLQNLIGNKKIIRFYGALAFRDLKDCNGAWDDYASSSFEEIINISKGFVVSACSVDFGRDLAKVGKDIATLVGLPSLLLKERPVPETIKVIYQGTVLPPGKKEDGGFWFYEETTNTINFYSMEFVQDMANDAFKIEFKVDDGFGP
jgi:hypothetical protein